MNFRNVIALCAMLLVGYLMYAMPPPAESSSSSSSSGSSGAGLAVRVTHGRRIAPLKQMSAEVVARSIHDNEMDFQQGVTTPEEKQQAIDDMFYYEDTKKLVANAYCHLYPQEIARQMHDEGKIVAGVTIRFDQLSKSAQEAISQKYYDSYPEEFKELKSRVIQTIPNYYASVKFASDGTLFLISPTTGLDVLQRQGGVFRVVQNIGNRRKVKLAVGVQGNWFAVGLYPPLCVYTKGNGNRFNLTQEISINVEMGYGIEFQVGGNSENNKVIAVSYRSWDKGRVADIFSQSNTGAGVRFEHKQQISYDMGLSSIYFNSTATFFAYASRDGAVKIWSCNNQGYFTQTHSLQSPISPQAGCKIAISPNNRFIVLLTKNHESSDIVVWEQKSGNSFEFFQHISSAHQMSLNSLSSPVAISFNPDDSNWFASASKEDIKLWHLDEKSNAFREVENIRGVSYKISYGPNNLLAIGVSNAVQIWYVNPPLVERVRDHLLKRVMHEEMLNTEGMPPLESVESKDQGS